MSTRRKRYNRQAKCKTEKDGSTESDTPSQDTEHQRTMQIITRLSQKYLRTRITPGETSQDSVTTDTEQEYYGDEENSPETGNRSDVSMSSPQHYDAYDFESNDDCFVPRLVLSPVKANSLAKNKPRKPKKKSSSCQKKQEVSPKPQVQVHAAPSVPSEMIPNSRTVTPKPAAPSKNTCIKETPFQPQNSRKRKTATTSQTATSTSVSRRSSPRIRSLNESKDTDMDTNQDSGVFISPPVQKLAKLGSGQATSTPSSESRTQKMTVTSMDESQYGFDSLESPAIDVSPVKRVITPMSDYSSMSSSHFTSMDTSNSYKPVSQGFPFVLKQEEQPKENISSKVQRKAGKSRVKKVSKKEVQWAEKMNKEFEELENFELSIEG